MTHAQFDVGAAVKEAIGKAIKSRGRANIIVAGRTGVGKSTLINAVFQGDLAHTGQGRPVTKESREISKEGVPLRIIDTRGLEMADYNDTAGELRTLIRDRGCETDPNQHIHAGWICISEDSRRVEDAERALSEMLSEFMPVVGVITKARADQAFRAAVQQELPKTRNVVRVRAIREELDDGHALPTMGLEDLVELTMEVVPDGQRNAFAAAQKVNLNQKAIRAHLAVGTAAASAATAGALPIPFADAFVLVPIQIVMVAGISAVFGLDLSRGFLSTLVSGTFSGVAGTMGGRMLATSLLKLVPGAGSVAGGVIAGATAAALTTSFGEAYIGVLCLLLRENPDRQPTAEEITLALKTTLRLS